MAAGCSVVERVEREAVFRPVHEQWPGYSPAIAQEEELWIPVGGRGERLHGWWLASPGARYTIVFFHGARVNLSGSVYRLRSLRDAGYNVLAIDYRGFGRSSAALPSEQSVYEDALAAWTWLDERVPDRRRRVLYGHSLGGAIAAEVAVRTGDAAALVLESSFTSLGDLTGLPFGTQRLDVQAKLARIDVPVLVVHGADDMVVPAAMAERLYDAARGAKRLLVVEGEGHRLVGLRAAPKLHGALHELLAERR